MRDFLNEPELHVLNHSCAHVMAQAVKHLYPEAKFWVGPVVEEGFYYDMDLGDVTLNDEDLEKIEKEMKKICKDGKKIVRHEIGKEETLDEEEETSAAEEPTLRCCAICGNEFIPVTNRSAELAERFRVPLRVLSSMKEGPGTAVTPVPLPPGEGRLTAAACRGSLVTVVGSDLRALPFSPARRAAEALEEAGIRPEGSLETEGYLAVKVPPERAADALRCLHRTFFEESAAAEEQTPG